jgi:HprK-related kinase B
MSLEINDILFELCYEQISTHIYAHSITLQFGLYSVKILNNNKKINEELEKYFNEFHVVLESADITIYLLEVKPLGKAFFHPFRNDISTSNDLPEFWIDGINWRILYNKDTGITYGIGSVTPFAIGPCSENIGHITRFISSVLIYKLVKSSGLYGHGSAVSINNKGLAICGGSRSGKTTVALELMSQGGKLISHDRIVFLNRNNIPAIHGVAQRPVVDRRTIEENNDLKKVVSSGKYTHPDKQKERFEIPVAECFGRGNLLLHSLLDCLFILDMDPSSKVLTSRNKLNRDELIDYLDYVIMTRDIFHLKSQDEDETYMRDQFLKYLEQCSVYLIHGEKDLKIAAELILKTVKL